MKKIIYENEARETVLNGAKKLYDAVKVTYGVKGKNVVIDTPYSNPVITHDGVTVAESIDLGSAILGENVGAKLIKTAAQKLNKVAGDGTTTVTVLTYNILEEANKLVVAGKNPMVLRREIEESGDKVVKCIEPLARKVEDKDKIADIATISAGDRKIGEMIAEVIDTVGADGTVTVEEGRGFDDETEIVEGYTYDRGYASPLFATDPNTKEAILENTPVLITDYKITSASQIVPIMQRLAEKNIKNLVIIAEEVSGEALNLLVLNKVNGVFNTVVLNAPAFGDNRIETMLDISALIGGKVCLQRACDKLEELEPNMLGFASKVIADKDSTTIIYKNESSEEVKERINSAKEQLKKAKSEVEKMGLESRISALLGKVAIIRVGGATETEIEEKKFRVDDAVCATKAALSDGYVAGGGVTLVNVATCMTPETDGDRILINALKTPFIHIMENAGLNAQALLAKVEETCGMGINVLEPENGLIDMKQNGIIDPAKVTKEAVKTAVSIASNVITIGALVVDVPEDDKGVSPLY